MMNLLRSAALAAFAGWVGLVSAQDALRGESCKPNPLPIPPRPTCKPGLSCRPGDEPPEVITHWAYTSTLTSTDYVPVTRVLPITETAITVVVSTITEEEQVICKETKNITLETDLIQWVTSTRIDYNFTTVTIPSVVTSIVRVTGNPNCVTDPKKPEITSPVYTTTSPTDSTSSPTSIPSSGASEEDPEYTELPEDELLYDEL